MYKILLLKCLFEFSLLVTTCTGLISASVLFPKSYSNAIKIQAQRQQCKRARLDKLSRAVQRITIQENFKINAKRTRDAVREYSDDSSWITMEKYDYSVYQVIAEAIQKCIMKEGEFSNAERGKLIEFACTPYDTKYTRANWSALIIYNLIAQIRDNHFEYNKDSNRISDDALDLIIDSIKLEILCEYTEKLQNDYQDRYQGLTGLLNKSAQDIKKYVKSLKLAKYISQLTDDGYQKDTKSTLQSANNAEVNIYNNNKYEYTIKINMMEQDGREVCTKHYLTIGETTDQKLDVDASMNITGGDKSFHEILDRNKGIEEQLSQYIIRDYRQKPYMIIMSLYNMPSVRKYIYDTKMSAESENAAYLSKLLDDYYTKVDEYLIARLSKNSFKITTAEVLEKVYRMVMGKKIQQDVGARSAEGSVRDFYGLRRDGMPMSLEELEQKEWKERNISNEMTLASWTSLLRDILAAESKASFNKYTAFPWYVLDKLPENSPEGDNAPTKTEFRPEISFENRGIECYALQSVISLEEPSDKSNYKYKIKYISFRDRETKSENCYGVLGIYDKKQYDARQNLQDTLSSAKIPNRTKSNDEQERRTGEVGIYMRKKNGALQKNKKEIKFKLPKHLSGQAPNKNIVHDKNPRRELAATDNLDIKNRGQNDLLPDKNAILRRFLMKNVPTKKNIINDELRRIKFSKVPYSVYDDQNNIYVRQKPNDEICSLKPIQETPVERESENEKEPGAEINSKLNIKFDDNINDETNDITIQNLNTHKEWKQPENINKRFLYNNVYQRAIVKYQ